MALAGRAALVLGGASGIGLVTVAELLREDAKVAVGDVSAEAGQEAVDALRREFGAQRVFFLRADVCSETEMDAVFVATIEKFKRLDIFINCAGIFNDFKWNLEVDINIKGVIRGTLLAWKYMGKHEGGGGGLVINIASQLGLETFPGSPIYCATKHAVIGFGRSCGMQPNFDHTAVAIITVCPALTDTPLVKRTHELKQLNQFMEDETFNRMERFPKQNPENVAKGIVHVIQHGRSGSVWVSEDDKPIYEVAFQERQDMRVTC